MRFRRSDPDRCLRELRTGSLPQRVRAAGALRTLPDARAARALVDALRDDEHVVRGPVLVTPVADAAAASLAALGAPAVEALIGALGRHGDHRDVMVRLKAARCLGEIGDERAVGPLVEMLGDDQAGVREAAITALVRLGAQAVGPLRVAAARRDGVAQVGACRALVSLGDASAVDLMVHLLQHGDMEARGQAARALGATRDRRAVAPLLECLHDDDIRLRADAMVALMHVPAACDDVARILTTPDGALRRRAVAALWDAVRFGNVRGDPLAVALVVAALKASCAAAPDAHESPLTFMWMLVDLGDERGRQLRMLVDAGDERAVQRAVADL